MANYMYCNWWSKPYFTKDASTIPPRTNSLLWKDDNYHHMLPVCDDIFKTEFQGNGEGFDILISAYTPGYKTCSTLAFVLASGGSPFDISKKCTTAGFEALGTPGRPREYRK